VKRTVRPSYFAQSEIEYYLRRYERESVRLRDRLWDDIEAVVDLIATYPSIGETVRRTRGLVRRFPLHDFPFFLVYRERHDYLQIIALAHKSRKPNYWRPRLKFDG
jgi:plasmid stabilization system protein ParE